MALTQAQQSVHHHTAQAQRAQHAAQQAQSALQQATSTHHQAVLNVNQLTTQLNAPGANRETLQTSLDQAKSYLQQCTQPCATVRA